MLVIQLQAALDSAHKVVAVVALEGKAQAALAELVTGGDGVLQAAGGVDNGHGAVAHGVHLAETAGLALTGHQVDVAAGIDPGSKT